jgi:hypothetical protein
MRVILMSLLIVLMASCVQKYNAPVKPTSTGYLVVEGYINIGNGPTNIMLSRTTPLNDSAVYLAENGGTVVVEGSHGDSDLLNPQGNGLYSAVLNLNQQEQYRVRITTSNGEQYLSGFEQPQLTPPIDSIFWTNTSSGVQVFAATHDPTDSVKYYLWNYEETWEFHTLISNLVWSYDSALDAATAVAYRYPDMSYDSSIYQCWQSDSSSTIILGASNQLGQSVIDAAPITSIPHADVRLSVEYSIEVDQIALSKNAYTFFQQLETSSTQLGFLFSPLPWQPAGNINCLTNPKETVVGYVYASRQQSQRIFIGNLDVPGWGYLNDCTTGKVVNNPDSVPYYYYENLPTVPYQTSDFGSIINYFLESKSACVDCTLTGTNQKPGFWP